MLFRIALILFSCAIMQCLFAIRTIFIPQEISFRKKFHSAKNFIRHGTQKPKFDNLKRDIRNVKQTWRKAWELTKIVGKQEFLRNEISCGMKFLAE